MSNVIKKYNLLLLLFICSIPAIFALTQHGFFVSDDGEWMIIRLSAFYETLKSFEFPVRFIPRLNNGFGYPLGDFMYPGFLYLGSFFHLLGFDFTNSIKLIFGLSMVLSGVWTYLWLQKIFSKYTAFFAANIYMYMPYHLYDIYTRGSVGEVLALCVVPFIFWQIERDDLFYTSLGIGFLLLSHNTLAFLFIIPLYLYLILRTQGKGLHHVCFAMIPFIIGACLSSFFWFPALYDLQYTIFKSVVIGDWRNYFASIQLIGIPTLGILCVCIYFLLAKKITQSKLIQPAYLFLGVAIVSTVFSLSVSSFIWQILPANIIQFPFRFLSLLIPSTAFLYAFITNGLETKKQVLVGIGITILVLFFSLQHVFPKSFIDKGDAYYISNFSTTSTKDEYMPIWVKKTLPGTPAQKVEIVKGMGSIISPHITPKKINFNTQIKNKSIVQINTVYFPGWEAIVDGKKTQIIYNNPYGLLQIPLDSGNHVVSVFFTETPIRLIMDGISLMTVLLLGGIFFTKLRYNTIQTIKIHNEST